MLHIYQKFHQPDPWGEALYVGLRAYVHPSWTIVSQEIA